MTRERGRELKIELAGELTRERGRELKIELVGESTREREAESSKSNSISLYGFAAVSHTCSDPSPFNRELKA